ncbi:MAG TPA: tRNA (5-methylaminomethyl-2-thiouridylate)-methyltransferase [Lacunisphaera sp.]|jgi:uncharacterized membrane protein HdeD (DUF308 family)
MITDSPLAATAAVSSHTEARVLHSTQTLLRYLFTIVPIIAGADKFTNLLTSWQSYLNPLVLKVVPVSAPAFMHIVGVIEIVAGILVFVKPRVGAWVVMAWLIAIALQLLVWGQFLDVAVRDIVIALSGALILARLTPLTTRN